MSDAAVRGTAARLRLGSGGWGRVLGPGLLSLIVVAGLALRLAGIANGAPFIAADEWIVGKGAMHVVTARTWDVLYYYYPTLLTYLLVPFTAVLHVIGHIPLTESSPMLVREEALPSQFPIFLAGRLLVALMGTATIVVSFESARRLVGIRGGLIAAALVAFSGVLVDNSEHLTTDVPAALMAALALLAAIVAWERRSARWVLASAFVAGLAASTKYNVGLVVIVAVMAWLSILEWPAIRAAWRTALRRNRPRQLVAAASWRTALLIPVVAVVGLVIATPAVLLAPRLIAHYLQLQAAAYGAGAPTGPLPSLAFNLQYLWDPGLGPVACILVALGVVRLVVRRRPPELFVLAFGVAYLIVMSIPPVHFQRNLVPLVPFAAIAGAEAGDALIGAVVGWERRLEYPRSIARFAALAITAVVVAGLTLNPVANGLAASSKLAKPDTRVVAYDWLTDHVPGARIARDGYTPVLIAPRFDGHIYWPLSQNSVAWYRSNGFLYLVLSDEVYSRAGPGSPLFAGYSAMLNLPVVFQVGPGTDSSGPTIVIVRL